MGIPTRHEPPNTQELRKNAEIFAIFEAADWTEFFQRLNGFHCETALQFALNLTETYSEVRGLRIEVSEAIVAEVTGLPQVGRAWFGRRNPNAVAVQGFLVAGEQLLPSGWGIELQSFPRSWDQVVIFLKKYITCEGRYQTVYYSEFPLLSHLHHKNILNVPFFLFKDLHHMAGFVRAAKHPYSSLTHHGLI